MSAKRKHVSEIAKSRPVARDVANDYAEAAVIGCVLLEPSRFYDVRDYLAPHDFTDPFHVFAWKAIEEISAGAYDIQLPSTRATPDIQNLRLYLHSVYGDYINLSIDDITTRLGLMMNSAPEPSNIATYTDNVVDAALRIRMIEQAQEQERQARDKSLRRSKLIEQSTAAFMDATQQVERHDPAAAAAAEDFMQDVLARRDQGENIYADTGIYAIDQHHLGGTPGTITHFVGGTGEGKSTFATTLLRNDGRSLKDTDKLVVMFSYEMTRSQIMESMFAMESGVYRSKMQDARLLSDAQVGMLKDAMAGVSTWPLFVFDKSMTPEQTVSEARRKLMQLLARNPGKRLHRVIFDGLWMMHPDGGRRGDNETDVYTEINRAAITLAGEFNCPVWMMHQLRDDVMSLKDSEHPHFGHIKGRGRATEDSHCVLAIIRRRALDAESKVQIYNLKRRNLPRVAEPIIIGYNRTHACYEDVSHDDISAVDF